jgi:hypothetical protein
MISRHTRNFNRHPLFFSSTSTRWLDEPPMGRDEAYTELRSCRRWSLPGAHPIGATITTMPGRSHNHDEAGFVLKGVSR